MNLAQTISLIQAFGTSEGVTKSWDTRGRGRHAPPKHAKDVTDKEWKKLWKKLPAPEPVHVDPYLVSKTKQQEKSLPSKLFKKWEQKQEVGVKKMQQWKEQHIAKTAEGTTIKNGDTVRNKVPIRLWNEKYIRFDKFPPNTKFTVINVLPKIGTADQMVSIAREKHQYAEYVKVKDVELHKAVSPEIDVQPVPKSQVKQQYTSSDGAKVTIVKSQETKEYTPKTIQELAKMPSKYKGQFEMVDKVTGADGNITRLYDSIRNVGKAWEQEGPSAAYKSGQTVWVHRYSDKIIIQEQSYQKYGMKAKGRITWKYDKPQKFLLAALGMLKRRYGIKIPSKEKF